MLCFLSCSWLKTGSEFIFIIAKTIAFTIIYAISGPLSENQEISNNINKLE